MCGGGGGQWRKTWREGVKERQTGGMKVQRRQIDKREIEIQKNEEKRHEQKSMELGRGARKVSSKKVKFKGGREMDKKENVSLRMERKTIKRKS